MLKNAKKSKNLGIDIRNASSHHPPIDQLAAEVENLSCIDV